MQYHLHHFRLPPPSTLVYRRVEVVPRIVCDEQKCVGRSWSQSLNIVKVLAARTETQRVLEELYSPLGRVPALKKKKFEDLGVNRG